MFSTTNDAAPQGRSMQGRERGRRLRSAAPWLLPLLAAAFLLPNFARAQSPLDGFDPGMGASEPVHAVAVQADGKVLIGGQFTAVDGRPRTGVARLNRNGVLDETFTADTNGTVFSLQVQADGHILIGGSFTEIAGQPRTGLARLNPDGTVDAAFAPAVEGAVLAILEQPDGKLVIGGVFPRVGGQLRGNVARLESDGRLDLSFNPGWGADGSVLALARQQDGKLLIGGEFQAFDGQVRRHFARLDPSGALDPGFDYGTDGTVRALAVQADGFILVGGSFTTIGAAWRVGIARLNPYGGVDGRITSFPGAPDVYAIAVQADGRILLGGDFGFYNGVPRAGLARLEADGSLDRFFDPGTDGLVRALRLQAEGRILVGGAFTTVAGEPRRGIARLAPEGTLDGPDFAPAVGWPLYALAVQPDGRILAGGTAYDIGSLYRFQADGTVDATYLPWTATVSFFALAVQADGKILVGGSFPWRSKWDIRGLVRLTADGRGDAGFNPEVYGAVSALAVQADGKFLIGGGFYRVGATGRNGIARLNADGTVDAAFDPGSGANSVVRSVAVQPDGKVLIGGMFTTVRNESRYGIARLNANGTLDAAFDPGLDGAVQTLAVQADGKILIVGSFQSVAGQRRPGFARLNADGTLDAGFVPPDKIQSVAALALQADGKVLALCSLWGGTHVVRFNADGSLDAGFDAGVDGHAEALAIQPDGRVLVAGSFAGIGGGPQTNLARLTNTGAPVETISVDRFGDSITWMRSGVGPEVSRVTFEGTLDGVHFTPFGEAGRIPGGWRLSGLGLPAEKLILIRARGWYASGYGNGSASLVEVKRYVVVGVPPGK